MEAAGRTIGRKRVTLATIILFTLVILLSTGSVASEGKFPTGPVTIINPLRPGGGTDIELRNLAPYVQKYLGVPVVVKSMPGGSTTIGASAAARAKPDGYTLICMPLQHGILAQEFHGNDSHLETFEAVYGWFEGPMDVAVNTKSPFVTFGDLVKAGKKRPLKASLAGIGSIDHLHTLLLEKYIGMKFKMVPYGGGGPATAAVIKGEVECFVGLSTTSVRFVRANQLRVLAILGPERLEALPDVPTIYELGYKDYPYISFIRGVLAPPGTPKDVVRALEDAFRKAVDDPGFRAIMQKQGRPVKPFSSEQMARAAKDVYKLAKKYVPFMKKAAQKK